MYYESTYRRGEVAGPALLAIVITFAGGTAWALAAPDGQAALWRFLWIAASAVLGLLALLATAFRVHRWTLTAGELRVEERPKLPFAGRRRHALVPFDSIAGIYTVESGFDLQIELRDRDGRAYRITQASVLPGKAGEPPSPSLAAWLSNLQARANAAGVRLPEPEEGLGFWNRAGGIATLVLLCAASLALAALGGLALFATELRPGTRVYFALAVVLLLPAGAVHLLLKALRRRRLVLRRRRPNSR